MACSFHVTIGGKFVQLVGLRDEDMDIDTMIFTYNTAVTDAASEILEILGKECRRKQPWVTKDVLDFRDERKDLRKNGMKRKDQKNTGKQTGGFRRQ